MIQSPSSFTARIKDSRSWPSGRSDASPCNEGLAASLPACSAGASGEQADNVADTAADTAAVASGAKGRWPGDAITGGAVRVKPSPASWPVKESGEDSAGESGENSVDQPSEVGVSA